MPCRQLSLHLVELLKSGGSVGYFHAGGCLEVLTGFVIVAFESRKDSGGVDCRGAIAGFCDVALCYSIVSRPMAAFAALRLATSLSGYMRTAVSNISLYISLPGSTLLAARKNS